MTDSGVGRKADLRYFIEIGILIVCFILIGLSANWALEGQRLIDRAPQAMDDQDRWLVSKEWERGHIAVNVQ